MPPVKATRNLRPSRSQVVGAATGATLAPLVVAVLGATGVPVTPELAAALGPALSFLFGYFTPGGRQGERE